MGASKNGVGQVSITTEIVRIASSKIIGGGKTRSWGGVLSDDPLW